MQKYEVREASRDRRWSTGMIYAQDKQEENTPLRLPPKPKRTNIGLESNLPDIEESEEGFKEVIEEEDENSESEHSEAAHESQHHTSKVSVFQTEIDQDSVSSKCSSDVKRTGRKTSCDVRFKEFDKSSDKDGPARVSNESRVAHADECESTRTLETSDAKSGTITRHGSSKTSTSSVAKPDRKLIKGDRGTEDGKNDNHSQKSSKSGTISPGGTKPSQMKCIHGNNLVSGKDTSEKVNKIVKSKSKSPCLLCEATDEAERMAQTESNKLMLEIVYPHEFYDRYSRGRNSKKLIVPQNIQKETITICKPAKVTRKVTQPERSWNRVPQSTTKVPGEGGVLQYSGTIPEKKRKQEELETETEAEVGKKEIHLQCKPKMNALVITDNTRGQKMVLKGLKGWILRKHEECKNKMHRDIKQSLYQVSTLGMQFGLPEYNTSLHDRKPTSPRPVTCMTARSQENVIVLRPNTLTLGPRQRTMPAMPRDQLMLGQQRGFGVLQRDLTNIPPRFHVPTGQENSAKSMGSRANSSQKILENAIAKVMKVGLSLPPIKNDMKATMALAHTPT